MTQEFNYAFKRVSNTCWHNFYSSIIHKNQHMEQIQLSISRWSINKMWYTHVMEYCSHAIRNEVLIYAARWMNLENIMVDEEARHKRPHIVWFHLYEISKIHKSIEKESRLMIARNLAEGGWRVTVNWYRIYF